MEGKTPCASNPGGDYSIESSIGYLPMNMIEKREMKKNERGGIRGSGKVEIC